MFTFVNVIIAALYACKSVVAAPTPAWESDDEIEKRLDELEKRLDVAKSVAAAPTPAWESAEELQ